MATPASIVTKKPETEKNLIKTRKSKEEMVLQKAEPKTKSKSLPRHYSLRHQLLEKKSGTQE